MGTETVIRTTACQCGCAPPALAVAPAKSRIRAGGGGLLKSVPTALISVGIAFFPKCPLCWAAYMGVLGSIGFVRLPAYQPWMLPVLVALLGLHLYLLFRQLAAHRYWPFGCSVVGAVCILLGRGVFPLHSWLALAGIGALVLGSLLNSFSVTSSARSNPQLLA
jgi:mercuric ion transport protein